MKTTIIDNIKKPNDNNTIQVDNIKSKVNDTIQDYNTRKVDTINKSKQSTNVFLANCISIFHTLVVLFVLLAPFIDIPAILILHITFSICLLVHWWANNNICSLSYIESQLRGTDHTESFTHKFIAPIYDISKTEWSQICKIITIILLCISLYNLYYSKKTADIFRCYNKLIKDDNFLKKPFLSRLSSYIFCFKDLFILR
jgi:predicted neutral ceramidase superfamily lipid hydrolase